MQVLYPSPSKTTIEYVCLGTKLAIEQQLKNNILNYIKS